VSLAIAPIVLRVVSEYLLDIPPLVYLPSKLRDRAYLHGLLLLMPSGVVSLSLLIYNLWPIDCLTTATRECSCDHVGKLACLGGVRVEEGTLEVAIRSRLVV
jgi:hypothetical protein